MRKSKNSVEELKMSTSRIKEQITVINTFPICPPVSGGQQRIYYLVKYLASTYDVTVLTVSHSSYGKKGLR